MAITMKDSGKFPLVIAKVLLGYLCLWPLSKSKLLKIARFISLANMLIITATHLLYMSLNITDMAVMARSCTTVSTCIQTSAKIILLSYYSDDLADILTIISNDYWPANIADYETEHSILMSSRLIVGMVCVYLTTAFISCWDFMAIDLVYGRRILPFESWYPFKWDVSPVFELLYVWQFFSSMYLVIDVIAHHDFFLNALLTCSIAQIKLLKFALRSIGTGRDLEINKKLIGITGMHRTNGHILSDEEEEFQLVAKCVEHHNRIILICDNLERIYGKMILLQFFLSATALCVSTFVLTNFDNYLTKMLSFSTAHLIQFFFLCVTGNTLIHESISIADAAYDSEWYNKAYPNVRHGLRLIMQRAQREQKITAMGFANLDFPNFINVLRLSFSFYTLLSSIQEE